MRALLQGKGTRLHPVSYGFLRRLRQFQEWWRPGPHAVQRSHRETPSVLKRLAPLGAHLRTGPSAT